jgi:hypothetical protein
MLGSAFDGATLLEDTGEFMGLVVASGESAIAARDFPITTWT